MRTFERRELGCLIRAFRERFGTDFTLTQKEVKASVLYRNALNEICRRYGERIQSVHARPIWYQDEKRLIACTSVCTAGLRDRALIRVLVLTGARASDVAALHKRQHVEVTVDHNGEPAIYIQLPSLKNQRDDVSETWITGEPYLDVKAWIDRRRVIFRESPYFFVTNKGNQISAPSIDMSFKTLCQYAGYGPRFFSAHSGRMGFASRAAAQIFCDGGNVNDIYARMGATGLWAPRSEAIERYCDVRTKRFFEGPGKLSWDQFVELSPEVMHGTEPLEQPLRREAAWFHQDDRKLRLIARNMGKD